jgi:hypothetical protein
VVERQRVHAGRTAGAVSSTSTRKPISETTKTSSSVSESSAASATIVASVHAT